MNKAEQYLIGEVEIYDLEDEELAALSESYCCTDEQDEEITQEIVRRFRSNLRKRTSWENHGGWDDEADENWLYAADSDPYDIDRDMP